MYLGSHAISMDAKGRIAIPTRFRDELQADCAGSLVVTVNPEAALEERCLWFYPEQEWARILPSIQALPTFNKVARRTQRLMIGHATKLEVDANGRVLLPPTLRDYAGLDKKLMMVGQGNKLELWSEERWQNWVDDIDGDEEIPEAMMNLSL